jgi:hypothetical protein
MINMSNCAHRDAEQRRMVSSASSPVETAHSEAVFGSTKSEAVMKTDNQDKLKMPDLRHGVEGSVLVKDTNENFAGNPPNTAEPGSAPVGPGGSVPAAGQTTHE